jgi:hypothetical protein
LDVGKVVICPAYPACEAVVLQPIVGISFVVVLDDVIGRSKMLSETRVAHVALERLWPWPFRAKAVPFSIVALTAMSVVCVLLKV